jgi:hypothetical protein
MLSSGKDVNMIINLLSIKAFLCHFYIKENYQFSSQSQALGHIIKDGNQVIIRHKPAGTIIYVLHHPSTTLVIDNFINKVKQLDSIFIKPINS